MPLPLTQSYILVAKYVPIFSTRWTHRFIGPCQCVLFERFKMWTLKIGA